MKGRQNTMKAIVTYDQNYGISSCGVAPMKIATMRKRYMNMVKGQAVLMSSRYFNTHGVWPDDSVKTIVIEDNDSSFFTFTHRNCKDNGRKIEDGPTVNGPYHGEELENVKALMDTDHNNKRYGGIRRVRVGEGIPTYYVASHINDLFAHERENDETIFVVGDGTLFTKIIPFCENIYATKIAKTFDNMDDVFPDYVEKCKNIFVVEKNEERKQFSTVYNELVFKNTKIVRDPIGDIYNTEPKKFVFLIGETNSGKDTLATWLTEKSGHYPEFNLNPIVSYTDRPERPYETNGVEHFFITPEESEYMLKYCNHMIVAKTEIGDGKGGVYHYFGVVNEIIDGANLYVIDPNGARNIIGRLRTLWPGSRIYTIFVNTPAFIRKFRARKRADWNPEVYNARCVAEAYQFDKFRDSLKNNIPKENVVVFNNYGFGQEKRKEELFNDILSFMEGWDGKDGKLPD